MFSQGLDFWAIATTLEPVISENVTNPETWGLLISNILWNAEGNTADYDRFCGQYGPKGTQAKLQREQDEADQWGKDLLEAGINPSEALSLAYSEAQMIAHSEQRFSEISQHRSPLAIPQELTRLVLCFYRPGQTWKASRKNILAILSISAEAILKSPRSSPEELVLIVAGRVLARMNQVRNGTAVGRWVLPKKQDEAQAVFDYAYFLVWHVLDSRFDGDTSIFASKQWGLICDAIYAIMRIEIEKD